ncbi:TIR domain-containing protein [Lautropia mirabilis]|uniref:TIR domain-containing protein n=1 Tax=Lautropia mirabilis TaxID=47671 RepID=UPI0028E8C7C7|nr:TIR domain-containing protein [Lautropia mirabilis]
MDTTQQRTELEAMLRRWRLEPLILDQLPSEGQTIIEKLEKYTAEVKFAVVLATFVDRVPTHCAK